MIPAVKIKPPVSKFQKGDKVTFKGQKTVVERLKHVEPYGFVYKLKDIIGAFSEKEIEKV